jgi:hypothetical protein
MGTAWKEQERRWGDGRDARFAVVCCRQTRAETKPYNTREGVIAAVDSQEQRRRKTNASDARRTTR